ncbi:Galactosyl transferase [Lasiodiplodia theobromae]|nr:Galactosyl transferase [Lasiodiplodia theobromae]
MLPPIAPTVLERNPKFKVLYDDISQNKLNPDASTKDEKKQRLIDQAREELNTKRTDLAKTEILKSSLESLSARAADLPDELHEVVTIVAAQLNGRIPSSDREILQEDIEYFTDQRADLTTSTASLAAHRTALADLAAATLDAQTRLVEVVVRVLEQTVHGSAARAARAKAEHLAAVAKGLELKLSVTMLGAVAKEEKGDLEQAIEGYGAWLKREREELEHRKGIAEERLREFEEALPGRSSRIAHQGSSSPSLCQNFPVSSIPLLTNILYSFPAASSGSTIPGIPCAPSKVNVSGVLTIPGCMMTTTTPLSLSSTDRFLQIMFSAVLDERYA